MFSGIREQVHLFLGNMGTLANILREQGNKTDEAKAKRNTLAIINRPSNIDRNVRKCTY